MSERFAALARDQRAELLGLLTDLGADDWTRITACRDWVVKDLISHVVEVELLFGRVYRGELKEVTAEDADPYAGVKRWSHADGETVRYSLWHHGSATQRVIDSRSEESWGRTVTFHGTTLPLRHLLRMHFFDLALHSLDTASAVSVTVPWGERTPVIVEYCVRGAPAALDAAGRPGSGPVGVRVQGAGEWTIEHRDGSWTLAEPGAATETVWEPDAETLVLATAGRLTPADALARSTVTGDQGLVGALLSDWRVKG